MLLLHFDTIHGARLKTVEPVGEDAPLETGNINIACPISDDEIVHLLCRAVTAVQAQGKMPARRIGFIDGAHGIGHVGLTPLGRVSPDFFARTCYKWLVVPRVCAILHVPLRNQRPIHTTFPTSWGYGSPLERTEMESNDYFVRLFETVSATDNTPYLCVPAALEFREDVCGGGEQTRRYCERIAAEGGRRPAEILGTDVLRSRPRTTPRAAASRMSVCRGISSEGSRGAGRGWASDCEVDAGKDAPGV
ncbi:hypothetical protein DL770_010031 [Monosporascus sp. CRB-9-2]|nr:hypothetical protein DL770_010031 [Monosporascus sp. CRB-9-2]